MEINSLNLKTGEDILILLKALPLMINEPYNLSVMNVLCDDGNNYNMTFNYNPSTGKFYAGETLMDSEEVSEEEIRSIQHCGVGFIGT